MNAFKFLNTLKKFGKRAGSLLMLFQRTPAAQVLMPAEFNLASSSALLDASKLLITSVVGLGAYDSVAGATTLTQISGSLNGSAGEPFSATFQVSGSPSTPKSWRIVGTMQAGLSLPNIAGSTNAISGTPTESGSKTVTIEAWEKAGFSGGVVKKNITIAIAAPPAAAIATQPSSATINSGQTTTLTVTATGGTPITYQWYRGSSGDTSIPVGTNSASFTTPALTSTTSYWVNVSNSQNINGQNSNTATVTVRQPAAITTQPASTSINGGESATLSVVATGDAPLTYQWFQGSSGDISNPVGTNQSTFTTPSLATNTSYWVKVTNVANTAGALSNTATVTVHLPAAIATHPSSTSINGGQTATLSVTATGDAPLTYQWFQGNAGDTSTPVGTNQSTFTTPALAANTTYWVKVTNALNTTGALSNTATVTVHLPAAITTQPTSTSINGGESATLSVVATGDAPLTYEWFQGISGDTSTPVGTNQNSFTTPPLAAATSYWVKVTNALNTAGALSDTATVSILPSLIPSIFTPAGLATARTGISYSASLVATGGSTPYTWSLKTGSLPQGLSLSSDGVLSGTPSSFGNFTFTLEVADQEFDTDSREFSLTVNNLAISTSSLPTAVKGTPFSFALKASGFNPVQSWALQSGALPAGISLNTTTGVLSGTPTTPGSSTLTFRVTDNSAFSVTRALSLTISATFIKPVLDPVSLPTVTIGAPFLQKLSAQNYPKTFSVTGLPKGLKLNPASGEISGIPDVSGLFILQIRASNSAGSSTLLKAPLTIRALPKNIVGSFGGILQRSPALNQNLGGMFSLSVTSSGFYTFKLSSALNSVSKSNAASAFTATGRLAPSAPHIAISLAGQPLSLSINPASGAISGSLGAASLSGWRAAWNATSNPAENLVGYYSFAIDLNDPLDDGKTEIPQGSGFATASVSNSGAMTLVGKTADGEPVTSSPLLGANGEFWLYSPLYKNLGTLQGSLTLTEDPAGLFSGNSIAGLLTWSKPTTTSRAYAAFDPLNLKAEGAYLAPASKGNPALGLPDTGSVSLRFTDGGLADSDTDPDMNFTYTDEDKVVMPVGTLNNPGQVALSLNPSSGALSGTFTLLETTPAPFTRSKVPFQAQVVRLTNGQVKAAGFFLLPQVPTGTQKATDTAILSGGVQLIQSAP
jgi:hypothetical protein